MASPSGELVQQTYKNIIIIIIILILAANKSGKLPNLRMMHLKGQRTIFSSQWSMNYWLENLNTPGRQE